MDSAFAVNLLKSMLIQSVALTAPFLGIAMIVGLAVSLFQAVTSIHEQTLTFAPKALGVLGLMLVLLPWLVRTLVAFTTTTIQQIPQMVH
jgi:flagellar biosynthesis protein FliQ